MHCVGKLVLGKGYTDKTGIKSETAAGVELRKGELKDFESGQRVLCRLQTLCFFKSMAIVKHLYKATATVCLHEAFVKRGEENKDPLTIPFR